MARTTPRKNTIRCATGFAALSVGLVTTTACGLGQVPGHDHPGILPQHAIRHGLPRRYREPVVTVRVRAHMGRPGVVAQR